MKANSPRISNERWWESANRMCEDCLIAALMVLKEEFGFGDMRMAKLTDGVYKKFAEFVEYDQDGVRDIRFEPYMPLAEKTISRIMKIRAKEALPPELFDFFYDPKNRNMSFSSSLNAKKKLDNSKKEQQKISVSQASEMQAQLQAARSWAMDNQNYSAAFGKKDI